MKGSLIFILLFCGLSFAEDDEYVTVWAPKTISPNKLYQVFFKPTELSESTEIAVQISSKNVTLELKDKTFDKYSRTSLGFGKKSSINAYVTLFRKSMSKTGKCITRLMNVKVDNSMPCKVFVQTDKPIYKPGDKIRFRILVLNKKLQPYHLNNINVYIMDPNGEIVKEYFDLSDGKHLSVLKESFTLSKNTPLGIWKIKVVVDRAIQLPSSKDFEVKEYVLPRFEATLKIPKNKLRLKEILEIEFYAKYSFGEYVNGNVLFSIVDLSSENIIYKKEYINVMGSKYVTLNLADIGINQQKNMNFEARITFTEPESKLSDEKKTKFYVFGETTYQMEIEHQDAFIPGQGFNILVKIFDWKYDPIKNFNEDVKFKINYYLASGESETILDIVGVHSHLIEYDYTPPENATLLHLEISFVNSRTYRKTVERGDITKFAMEGLVVSTEPKIISSESNVKLLITGLEKMNKVIANAITHHGNNFSAEYDCNSKITCSVEFPINDDMKSHSSIIVYYVKDKTHIYRGEVKLQFSEMSKNKLNLDILRDEKQERQKNVRMKFTGLEKSTIYLLAIDKRLTYLRTGHDITRKEVDEKLSEFNTEYHAFPIDMRDDEWHDCTPEELVRVNTKRISTTQLSGVDQRDIFNDAQELDLDDETEKIEEVEEQQKTECTEEECILREEFPETWIFEELKFEKRKNVLEQQFKVPHSMTSWIVSAFSIHKDFGLAIAPQRELTIKNEFFIDINLPYSIRFKEILRLDVMIYNYLINKQKLNVIIHLNNKGGTEYEIIKYDNNIGSCNSTVFSDDTDIREISVPNGNVKKVSFYVRSKDTREVLPEKLNFKILSKGTDESGNIYRDIIKKNVLVAPIGIKDYEINIHTGDFSSFRTTGLLVDKIKFTNTTTTKSSINAFISGDYVINNLIFNANTLTSTSPSLLEATSEIKMKTEISKYNGNQDAMISEEFSKLYANSNESIRNNFIYHSYYADMSASVWKLNADEEKLGKNKLKLKFDELEKMTREWLNKSYDTEEDDVDIVDIDLLLFNENITLFGLKAFAPIPFFKHKDIFNDTYKNIAAMSLEILETDYNNANIAKSSMDLAIVGYAFALGGKYNQKLATDLERNKFEHGGKKCYKLKKSVKKCDVTLTAYIALTSLLVHNSTKVLPTVRWLYDEFKKDKSYSFERAITSEVFAELKKGIDSKSTSLSIEIKNNLSKSKENEIIRISTENARNVTHIRMSRYAKEVKYNVTGTGFWSIAFVYEMLKTTSLVSSNIGLAVKVSSNEFFKHVKVCGKYKNDHQTTSNPMSIYYEIDFPSGYIFQNILELKDNYIANITDIEVKNDKTLVIIKYLEFDKEHENCLTFVAKRTYEVINSQKSTVKAYDFNNKENIALEYYEFASSCN